jgi:hypothetical protein
VAVTVNSVAERYLMTVVEARNTREMLMGRMVKMELMTVDMGSSSKMALVLIVDKEKSQKD